jgi:hypothetical protein
MLQDIDEELCCPRLQIRLDNVLEQAAAERIVGRAVRAFRSHTTPPHRSRVHDIFSRAIVTPIFEPPCEITGPLFRGLISMELPQSTSPSAQKPKVPEPGPFSEPMSQGNPTVSFPEYVPGGKQR